MVALSERASGRGVGRERNVVAYVFLVAACLFSVVPMLTLLVNSLRPDSAIVTDPLGLPRSLDFTNYVHAWVDAGLGRYMVNSLIVTVGSLALGILASLPVAYALGRWSFRGKYVVTMLFLAGLMIPIRIGILPLFHFYEAYGLVDSLFGLILVYAASGMPMAVLILSTFYRGLPDVLEDAARIDGASEFAIFARVFTPLVKPAVATVLVLNVAPAWNDFFFPLIMMRSQDKFPLPVGVTTFFTEFSVDRGLLYAGLVIAAAPLAVLFALSMKQVVGGLTAGIEK